MCVWGEVSHLIKVTANSLSNQSANKSVGNQLITHHNHHYVEKMISCFSDTMENKISSGDEIANVNFYAVRPEATRIR